MNNEPLDRPLRQRGRISLWVLRGGTEPDPRLTLANERTFLAWIRTSLALMAPGVAVEAFMAGLFSAQLRKTLAIVLLAMALATAGGSLFRWINIERAIRRKSPLPPPLIAPVLAVGGAVLACAMIIFAVTR